MFALRVSWEDVFNRFPSAGAVLLLVAFFLNFGKTSCAMVFSPQQTKDSQVLKFP